MVSLLKQTFSSKVSQERRNGNPSNGQSSSDSHSGYWIDLRKLYLPISVNVRPRRSPCVGPNHKSNGVHAERKDICQTQHGPAKEFPCYAKALTKFGESHLTKTAYCTYTHCARCPLPQIFQGQSQRHRRPIYTEHHG